MRKRCAGRRRSFDLSPLYTSTVVASSAPTVTLPRVPLVLSQPFFSFFFFFFRSFLVAPAGSSGLMMQSSFSVPLSTTSHSSTWQCDSVSFALVTAGASRTFTTSAAGDQLMVAILISFVGVYWSGIWLPCRRCNSADLPVARSPRTSTFML